MRSLAAKVLLGAGSIVLLEGACFVVLETFSAHGPLSRSAVRFVEHPYHPFLGWFQAPNAAIDTSKACVGRTTIQTDESGFSITPYSATTPRVRIAITGGSAVFGVGSSANRFTLPSLLELLANRHGYETEVVNLGVRGYQSFQELLLLREYLLRRQVDLVIALSGYNDMNFGPLRPVGESDLIPPHTLDLTRRLRRQESGMGPAISVNWWSLRRASYTADLLFRLADRWAKAGSGGGTAGSAGIVQRSAESAPDWAEIAAEHFELMDRLGSLHGARFVMLLQPTALLKPKLHPEEALCLGLQSPGRPEKLAFRRECASRFYSHLGAMSKTFAFADLSSALDDPDQALFVDSVHFNDEGAQVLARRVFETIRGTLDQITAAKRLGSAADGAPDAAEAAGADRAIDRRPPRGELGSHGASPLAQPAA